MIDRFFDRSFTRKPQRFSFERSGSQLCLAMRTPVPCDQKSLPCDQNSLPTIVPCDQKSLGFQFPFLQAIRTTFQRDFELLPLHSQIQISIQLLPWLARNRIAKPRTMTAASLPSMFALQFARQLLVVPPEPHCSCCCSRSSCCCFSGKQDLCHCDPPVA